jgi:type II secretory pathway predicted ATPase ExeA
VDQLKQFLFARFKEQQACVLFIDEAQQMKGSLLESLRGLLNFEDPAAGGKLLQIILLAMPGINRKLRFAPSFSNRVVRTQLHRMNRQEMADMLEWRFVQAGGRIFPFDSPTLDALFKMSKGNPRTVCGIGQVALEIAGTTERAITPEVVQEVSATRIAN